MTTTLLPTAPAASWTLPSPATVPAPPRTDAGRAARRDLRRQIALLEARLTALVIDLGEPAPSSAIRATGPRVLGLGGLERCRDQLAARVAGVQARMARRESDRARARARLEAMIAAPSRHRFERVSREELGEPGCGAYEVRPRLGLVGMLAGWWEVKLSSGCPLARSHPLARTVTPAAAASPRPRHPCCGRVGVGSVIAMS